MAYRVRLEEPLSVDLLRIVREEIGYAIEQLFDHDPSTRDEAIHEARKSIKKIRAILRLLGADKAKNALLRDAGRMLSSLRDAAALVETVESLQKNNRDEAFQNPLATLRRNLIRRQRASEKRHDPKGALSQTIDILQQFELGLDVWPERLPDFRAVAAGWKMIYRSGRQTLAEAKADPSPFTFHELRKAVKNHWYNIRLLENIWPETMSVREECLKKLQEWLGDDHNLAVMRERMGIRYQELIPLMDARQQELRSTSIALADKIYAERPRDHLRLVESLWQRAHVARRLES